MNRRAGKPTMRKTTQLVNVEEHVEGFRKVREAHRRELIDDYVELISDLIREVGEARQVDMAARRPVDEQLFDICFLGLIEPEQRVVVAVEDGDEIGFGHRGSHSIQ